MNIETNGMVIQLSDSQTDAILNRAADRLLEIFQSKLRGGMEIQIPTVQVKAILKQKGYRVSTTTALNNMLSRHGIYPDKKGREYWYNTELIQKLPNKR